MKAEEIKVGMYVMWYDISRFGGISYPGIIGAFENGVATIITFDDFKAGHCSLLDNLSRASLASMREYLRVRITEGEAQVNKFLKAIEEKKDLLAQYQAKLAELSKLPQE